MLLVLVDTSAKKLFWGASLTMRMVKLIINVCFWLGVSHMLKFTFLDKCGNSPFSFVSQWRLSGSTLIAFFLCLSSSTHRSHSPHFLFWISFVLFPVCFSNNQSIALFLLKIPLLYSIFSTFGLCILFLICSRLKNHISHLFSSLLLVCSSYEIYLAYFYLSFVFLVICGYDQPILLVF